MRWVLTPSGGWPRAAWDVLGFEQFRPGHVQGSSHGHPRLFRVACLEHPNLVPLAQRSLELWRELAERAGTPVIEITGGLMIGPPTATWSRARWPPPARTSCPCAS